MVSGWRLGLLALSLGAALWYPGCDDETDTGAVPDVNLADARDAGESDGSADATGDTADAPDAMEDTAGLRALHALAGGPLVDLYLDETIAAQAFGYGEGTGFLTREPGAVDVAVTPAGEPLSSSLVTVNAVPLAAGSRSTVVAYGPLDAPEALVLDDAPPSLNPGQAGLRLVQGASAFPAVDVWNVTGATPAPLSTGLSYGSVSPTLSVGTNLIIGVDVDFDSEPDATCNLPALTAGERTNLVLTALGATVQVVLQGATDVIRVVTCESTFVPSADVRMVHLSPTTPLIDVFFGDGPTLTDLAFLDAEGPVGVPAGNQQIVVSPAGGGQDQALLTFPASPTAGDSYSAVVFGPDDNLAGLVLTDDLGPVGAGSVRLRPVHVAPGLGTLGFSVLVGDEPVPLAGSVTYGAAANAAIRPAGAFVLAIDTPGGEEIDLTCDVPTIGSGTVANLYAVAAAGEVSVAVHTLGAGTVTQVPCEPFEPPGGTASLRVAHLAPELGPVGVTAGDTTVWPLPYLSAAGPFPVPSGSLNVAVAPTGEPAVLSFSADIEAEAAYTAVAYGPAAALAWVLLEDDLGVPPTGFARLRPVHAASGVGEVDLLSVGADGSTSTLVPDLGYGEVGAPIDAPALPIVVGIDTTNDALPELTCALPALPAGANATVFAVADDEGAKLAILADGDQLTAIDCLPVLPPGDDAHLRVVHLAAGTGTVDVYAGDEPTVEDLPYLSAAGPIALPGEDTLLSFAAAGQGPGDALLSFQAALQPGLSYSAVAFGPPGDVLGLLLNDDLIAPPPGNVRIRPVHTAAGVGPIDLLVLGGAPVNLASDLLYGQAAGSIEVPAAALTVGIDVSDDGDADLACEVPPLPSGAVVNLFAVADEGGLLLAAQLPGDSVVSVPCGPVETGVADVRVVHLAPGQGLLEVSAGASFEVGVEYLEAAGPLGLAAGATTFLVSPPGTGTVVAEATGDLADGGDYSVVAYGAPGEIGALLLTDDLSPPAAGNVRLRAAHTAFGVGPVDLYAIIGGVETLLLDDLAYGTAGPAAEIPATTFTVGIDTSGDGALSYTCEVPALAAGTAANVFAVADGAGLELVAQLPGDDLATIPCTPVATPGTGSVRVVHLAPQNPAVDVFADGDPLAAGLTYPEATGPLPVLAGEVTFAVTPPDAGPGAAPLTFGGSIADEGSYSAVVFGPSPALQGLLLEDDLSAPAAGNIRLRPVHAAFVVGAVDLYTIGAGGTATPLLQGLDYGAAGAAIEAPAGAYTIGIDLTGDAELDLACALPALPAGTSANVYAVADSQAIKLAVQSGGAGLTVVNCAPFEAPATLRVVHLAAGTGPLDFSAAGEAAAGVDYLDTGGPLDVPAGLTTVSVTTPAGDPALTFEAGLGPGGTYTAVAYGQPGALAGLTLQDDLSAPAPGNVRVRPVHTAAGIGPVDLFAISPGGPAPLLADLGYGQAGPAIELPSAPLTVGVESSGDTTLDYTCAIPALSAGGVFNVFAVVDAAGLHLAAQPASGDLVVVDCAPVPPDQVATVQAIHLAPAPPAVDFFVDGEVVVPSLAFAEGSDPTTVAAGPAGFDVAPAGAGIGASILSFTGSLAADGTYTAVTWGPTPTSLLLTNDEVGVPDPASRLRFVHVAPGLGGTRIAVLLPSGAQSTLVPGLQPGQVSSYQQGQGAPAPFVLDAGGDAAPEYVCEPLALAKGTASNIFIAPALPSGVQLIAQSPDGLVVGPCTGTAATADLRVVHVAPGAPALDVFAGGAALFTGLPYLAAAGPETLDAGSVQLAFSPTGAGAGAALLTLDATLTGDGAYTAAAYGPAGAVEGLLLLDDLTPPAAGVRLRPIHTAAGLGPVDLYIVSGNEATLLLSDVAYGEAAPATVVSAAALTLGVDATADGELDYTCDVPALPEGAAANVFAVTGDGGLGLVAQLGGDATAEIACEAVPPPASAVLRALHLASDTAPVDVLLGGDLVFGDLAFTEGAGPDTTPAGATTVSFAPTGAAPLASATATLTPDADHTTALYGQPGALAALVLTNDNAGVPATFARTRYVHVLPGAGPLRIVVLLPGGNTATLHTQLGYGTAGIYYQGFNGGPALPLGIDTNGDGELNLACEPVIAPSGTATNVFITPAPGGAQLVAQSPQGVDVYPCETLGTTGVRALHLLPEAGPVDILAGDVSFAGLAYLEGTAFAEVPPGPLPLAITPEGGGEALYSNTIQPDPGQLLTLVAFGDADSPQALVLDDTPSTTVPATSVRLRVGHVASGVGAVGAMVVAAGGNTTLAPDLAFGEVSDIAILQPGTHRLGLDTDGDGGPDLVAELPPLDGGTFVNVFATADAAGALSLVAHVPGGDTFNAPLLPFDSATAALVRAVYIGVTPAQLSFNLTGPDGFEAQLIPNAPTDFIPVTPGTYTASANTVAGGQLDTVSLTVSTAGVWTVVLFNVDAPQGGIGLELLPIEMDYSPYPGRTSRIRAVHLARTVGATSVLQLSATEQALAGAVTLTQSGPWLATDPGEATLATDGDGDGTPDLLFDFPLVPPGRTLLTMLNTGPNATVRMTGITRIGEAIATGTTP